MHWKTERRLKDAASIGLIASSATFLLKKASKSEGALVRAGRNAAIAASAVGAVAGGVRFADIKASFSYHNRDRTLEETAIHGGFFGSAAAIAAGVASLAWDAVRGKQRR